MKRIHPLTTIGLSLAMASVALVFSGYQPIACALALIGYFCTLPEVPKITSLYQNIVFPLQGTALGFTLDYGKDRFPFFTLICTLIAIAPMFRIYFHNAMKHTRFLWVEPSLLLVAIGGYVYANLEFSEGWAGWFYPAPPMAFSLFLTVGFIKGGMKLITLASQQKDTSIGKPAPDFELPDQTGQPVRLSSFKGSRHVLLIFIRGDWCPSCHMMMRTYEKSREKLREKNVLLLAIGPDDLGTNQQMAEKLGIEYKILTDNKQQTAIAYGSHQADLRLDKYGVGVPLPSTFIICDQGIIRYQSRADQVGEFLNPGQVEQVLNGIRHAHPEPALN
jgi:thioredoxin-dependent peroxiredoxin